MHHWRFWLPLSLLGGAAAGSIWFAYEWTRAPMLEVLHSPPQFAYRSGDLSDNVCGRAFPYAALRFRVNHGNWQQLLRQGDRTPSPWWSIELLPQRLRPGRNELEIEASALGRSTRTEIVSFRCDTAPPAPPLLVDWRAPLDVQDGHWEVIEHEAGPRVRPVPGSAGYDRIVMATGAFAGGRRVETDVTFRAFRRWQTWAGFGVLTLWGGHIDDSEVRPRRGWLYAIAWYMKPYGAWCEFSIKRGDDARRDTFVGRTESEPEPGDRYRLVAECWPETTATGGHAGWRQRMKLWPANAPEPPDWIETTDSDARLPLREYAVAVIAHECEAEFGPVRVLPLPAMPAVPVR